MRRIALTASLFVALLLVTACTRDLPDLGPTLAPLQTATPTAAVLTTSSGTGAGPSIESVFSYVASLPSGVPLRPLFGHLPKDREPISRLARALQAAVPIESDDRLHANDRGRYLSVTYGDGTNAAIRQVFRCLPKSEDDVGEPVTGWCKGEWVREDDTWWVEEVGMVKSAALSRWWDEMPEIMVRTGILSLPEIIEADEPFTITLFSWDDVIDGDSINLGLVSSDGREIGLGTFPSSDTFQGQLKVPDRTPSGRYWLRVSGGNFSELVQVVNVSDDENAGRREVSVREVWLDSPDRLVFTADTCNENPEVSLLGETDAEVRVLMSADSYPFRQSYPDCVEAITVQLRAPLGDRVVVDQHTGRVVSVVPVEIRTGQSLTETEIEEAVSAVYDAVAKTPGVLDAIAGFDPGENQIGMTVVLSDSAPDSFLDDLQAIAEKRLIEMTRADILDSISISIVRSENPTLVILEYGSGDGEGAGEDPNGSVIFPQHEAPLGTDIGGRYYAGQLVLDGGCLRVEVPPDANGPGVSRLLIWPSGFAFNEEEWAVRTLDGTGPIAAYVGDHIRLSSATVSVEEAQHQGLVQGLSEVCSGPYFLVGDEVTAFDPDNEPTELRLTDPDVLFPRQRTVIATGRSFMTAEGVGELVLDGRCLRLKGDGGRLHTIIWPAGFSPHVHEGVVQVRNGAGRVIAQVGDQIGGGGGYGRSGYGSCPGPVFSVDGIKVLPDAEVYFPQQDGTLGTDQEMERFVGNLVLDRRCLVVDAAVRVRDRVIMPGVWPLLIWPDNFTLSLEEEVAGIVDASGRVVARVGDEVQFRANSITYEQAMNHSGLREITPACWGPYWAVGEDFAAVPDSEPR